MMNLFSCPNFFRALLATVLLIMTGCGSSSKQELLRRGEDFLKQGKLDDAGLEFRKAIQKDPNYGEAFLRLGLVLQRQGKGTDAFSSLTQAEKLMPDSVEAKVALGRLAINALLSIPQRPQSMYDTAQRMADALLKTNPQQIDGLRLKGDLALADLKPKEAITYFRQILSARPDDAETTVLLIQALFLANEESEGEALARATFASQKTLGSAYDALYFHFISTKRIAEAEAVLKLKIANNPGNVFFITQLAEHYLTQKNSSEADKLLAETLTKLKNDSAGLMEIGAFYERIGRRDEAAALYEQGLSSPDPARRKTVQQSIIRLRIEAGQLDKAAAMIDQILKDAPSDVAALSGRAALRMATNQPAEMQKAVTDLQSLASKNPGDTSILLSLARAQRQMGQEKEARQRFREVLNADPRNTLALRELSDMAMRNRQPDEALQLAERFLAVAPQDPGALLVRTSAWALQGRYGEARAELRRLAAQYPNLPEITLQSGLLEMEERKFADAERTLRSLADRGDTRGIRALTTLYLRQGQAQRALTTAQELAKKSPSRDDRALVAAAALAAGNRDLALQTAQALVTEARTDPKALMLLGQIQSQTGQLDAAVQSFRQAVSSDPSDFAPAAALGEVLNQAGRYAEAANAFRDSLTRRPNEPSLQNNLAWNLALAETSLEEALAVIQNVRKSDPANPAYADTLGLIYLKKRQPELALPLFRMGASKEPGIAIYRLHLAQALFDLQRPNDARLELEAAQKTQLTASDQAELRRLLAKLR